MDYNLRRRASRNFAKLVGLLVSLAFFGALAPAIFYGRHAWSPDRWTYWVVPLAAAAMPAIVLFALVQQARRIGGFIPLPEAGSIWWAALRRRLKSGRPVTTREANALLLGIVLVFAPLIFYLGRPFPLWVVRQGGAFWPMLAVFAAMWLLIYPLARKASVGIKASRWFPAVGAAATALFPAVTVAMIAERRADALYFADGPVHRETVYARIEGPCRPNAVRKGRRLLCATAATSRGPIRHWPIRVYRNAFYLQRRVGTVCIRVPLEWAANGTIRIERGPRRYRAEEFVPCPPSLARIARAT